VAGSRIGAALEEGRLRLPNGMRALMVGAQSAGPLAALSPKTVVAVQPHQPLHDALLAAGVTAVPDFQNAGAGYDVAYISVPRSRERARHWVAAAAARLAMGGLLIVEGAKTDGIDPLYKALRGRLDGVDSVAKAHGRLVWGRVRADMFADWAASETAAEGFVTAPGAFSAEMVDPGSLALAQALPRRLPQHVVDLGAGWGYLATVILDREGVVRLDLVEADHDALAAARRNIGDARAAFHWADATAWQPDAAPSAVVMNPPFHVGRAADPGLGRAFIGAAAAMLAPDGALWMVANRHLPYERDLDTAFRDWHETGGTPAFKVLHAARPRRAAKGSRQ